MHLKLAEWKPEAQHHPQMVTEPMVELTVNPARLPKDDTKGD